MKSTDKPRLIRAYKFLRDDLRSCYGSEGPWTVGETRVHVGALALCESGYHASPTWFNALGYAPGNVAALVDVSDDGIADETKSVSRSCTVIAMANVAVALRLWGCDCAERALDREDAARWTVDPRSRAAIAVARRFASGQATAEELDYARAKTWDVAWNAAKDAAWATTWDLAWNAAWNAAKAAARLAERDAAWTDPLGTVWTVTNYAAWTAEREWQNQRLAERLDPLFAEVLA